MAAVNGLLPIAVFGVISWPNHGCDLPVSNPAREAEDEDAFHSR
jgi:hypothetical protein